MALKDAHGGAAGTMAAPTCRAASPRRWPRRGRRARRRDRASRVRPVPVLPPVDGAPRVRPRARHQDHRRRADLRRRRLGRRLGQPRAVPARRGRAGRRSSPACRPTTSTPTASSGAIRSTTGTRMRADGFAWWVARVCGRRSSLVDLVRLDHFRGFEAYWEVPADSPTARNGRWVPGAGRRALRRLCKQAFGTPAARSPRTSGHHAGVERCATPRLAGHEGPAVRVRRRRPQPVLAAQLRCRHASSTPARTTTTPPAAGIKAARRRSKRPRSPLSGPRRQRHRLGPDPPGLELGLPISRSRRLQDVLEPRQRSRMNFPGGRPATGRGSASIISFSRGPSIGWRADVALRRHGADSFSRRVSARVLHPRTPSVGLGGPLTTSCPPRIIGRYLTPARNPAHAIRPLRSVPLRQRQEVQVVLPAHP